MAEAPEAQNNQLPSIIADALAASQATPAEDDDQDTVLAQETSLGGATFVVDTTFDDGRPIRVLEVEDTWQSAIYLDGQQPDLVFPYHRQYDLALAPALGQASAHAPHFLMLGGGGWAYPMHLARLYPTSRVDVVENDPTILALARDFFLTEESATAAPAAAQPDAHAVSDVDADTQARTGEKDAPVQTHFNYLMDARAFLAKAEDGSYDAIFSDCFTAEEPAMSLATDRAVADIARALTPTGVYATNVVSALSGRHSQLLRDVCATLRTSFSHVEVLAGSPSSPRSEDNNLVFASNQPMGIAPEWQTRDLPRGHVLTES